MIAFLLIGIISVFGNSLVLIVIYKSAQLRHSQYIYKCSIALSDIIWGSAISIYFIYNCVKNYFSIFFTVSFESDYFGTPIAYKDINNITVYNYKLYSLTFFNKGIYKYEQMLLVLVIVLPPTFFLSICTLVIAAFDIFIALTYPFKYRKWKTLKYAKIFSILVWVVCIIVFVCIFLLYKGPITHDGPLFQTNLEDMFARIFSYIIIAFSFILWCITILTILSLYKNYKKSKTLNRSVSNRLAHEIQMTFILIAMIVAFTLCLSVTMFNLICNKFCEDKYYENQTLTNALLATNSIWNFLIYNIMNKKFRAALVKLFRKKQLQVLPNTISNT